MYIRETEPIEYLLKEDLLDWFTGYSKSSPIMVMAASYPRGKEPGNSKFMRLEDGHNLHQRPSRFWRVVWSSVDAEDVDSNISSGWNRIESESRVTQDSKVPLLP